MSTPSTPTVGEPVTGESVAPRPDDLVLARLHLRLGSLGLARTELESLAGRAALDDEATRDLAEARWRTGDIGGPAVPPPRGSSASRTISSAS